MKHDLKSDRILLDNIGYEFYDWPPDFFTHAQTLFLRFVIAIFADTCVNCIGMDIIVYENFSL